MRVRCAREQLIAAGIAFEQSVVSTAVVTPPDVGFREALAGDVPIYGLPLLRNDKLKIFGIPDGIDPRAGALVPIEIKSHKNLQKTDLLELAFYWLLLEPYRTRRDVEPSGRLILRRNCLPEESEVRLETWPFERVKKVLTEIRRARYYGVRPRVCSCPVCSGVLRDKIAAATQAAKDLTMIWGIDRAYAAALETMGLSNYGALANCDPEAVVAAFRELGYFVSVRIVDSWQRHAHSYLQAAGACHDGRRGLGDGACRDGRRGRKDAQVAVRGARLWPLAIRGGPVSGRHGLKSFLLDRELLHRRLAGDAGPIDTGHDKHVVAVRQRIRVGLRRAAGVTKHHLLVA
jgi:hypothetical protein